MTENTKEVLKAIAKCKLADLEELSVIMEPRVEYVFEIDKLNANMILVQCLFDLRDTGIGLDKKSQESIDNEEKRYKEYMQNLNGEIHDED